MLRAASWAGAVTRAHAHRTRGLLALTVLLLAAAGVLAALHCHHRPSSQASRPGLIPRLDSPAPTADAEPAPRIVGTPEVGRTLAVSFGAQLRAVRGRSYEWHRCAPPGHPCAAIEGASGPSFSPTFEDLGETLEVTVRAPAATGHITERSAATSVVIGTRNVYISQSGSGRATGSDCANARAAAWFDDASHWGSGSHAIRAGTMIHLCALISTPLIFHASGTHDRPITLYFEPGAKIALPVCPGRRAGCIDTNGNSHIWIDGGVNGSIRNTENGTALAHHQGESYGIEASDCNGCRIENLTIADLYTHTSPTDATIDATENRGITFSGSNLTIAHNTLHDIGWALVAEWSAHDRFVSIAHNNVYRIDHGLALTAAFSGGSIGPISVYGNAFHGYANWDTGTDAYHHDGIHCFSADARGYTPHYNGLYIYDNRFGGPTGVDMTAQIFIEGGSGEGSTPCADSTSKIWIFDNVASASSPIYNGIFGVYAGTPRVYSNTLTGSHASTGVCYRTAPPAARERFEDNLLASCNILIVGSPATFARLDYNLYASGGENAFVCGARFYAFRQFAKWRRCMRADSHSHAVRHPPVNGDGRPPNGSRSQTRGVNLSRSCRGPTEDLCSALNGHRRRSRGMWTIGAY